MMDFWPFQIGFKGFESSCHLLRRGVGSYLFEWEVTGFMSQLPTARTKSFALTTTILDECRSRKPGAFVS